MSLETLEIAMKAVKARLDAGERHADELSQVVGDALKAIRDNDKAEQATLRDQFAMNSPIMLVHALDVFGHPDADMQSEHTRAAVYGLWAFMRYEYADAMIRERAGIKGASLHHNGDKDGWISWNGDVCPVMSDVAVDVILRSGQPRFGIAANNLSWDTLGSSFDIVAYRVVRP